LVSLEVNYAIDVVGEIRHEAVLELGKGRVCGGVRTGDEDLQASIRNVRVSAASSDVVLGGPGKANSLTGSVVCHGILRGIGISYGIRSWITAGNIVRDLVVVTSVYSESGSSVFTKLTRVTSALGSIPILSRFSSIISTSDPRMGISNGQETNER